MKTDLVCDEKDIRICPDFLLQRKKMILALIDAVLTPMPFFEGDYTPHLEFLAELPSGKVVGHFDIVDNRKTLRPWSGQFLIMMQG